MSDLPKARIGWRSRCLVIFGSFEIAVFSIWSHSWWVALGIAAGVSLSLQYALKGTYFLGKASVHDERLTELLEAEVANFLESLDDE